MPSLNVGVARAWRAIIGAAVLLATLAACTTASSPDASTPNSSATSKDVLKVAAAIYPIEEVVTRVGGANVELVALTPPGEDPHERDLTAKQLDALASADAVFYLGEGFQPSIEKAIGALDTKIVAVDLLGVVDLLEADQHSATQTGQHSHGDHDPHVWLDPTNMVAIARAVSDLLGTLESSRAPEFADNARNYIADLTALGEEFDSSLAVCRSRVLVTAHAAFAYLARRAALEAHSISGLNPAQEPSARDLEELESLVRDKGVSTIYYETLLPGNVARTIAEATGARTDLLDPIENISAADRRAGATYVSIQRENLARLVTGLGCS